MKDTKKVNILVELAKRKAEARKKGETPVHFGSNLKKKRRPTPTARVAPSRGGRNGNGKPS